MSTDDWGVVYLEVDNALDAYAEAVECPREAAEDQLRSPDLLASALARPRNYAAYQGADIALQAAVLAHGVAENQPFVDGNKRAAEVAMLGFLAINGYEVDVGEGDLFRWMIELSEGLTPEELAEQLRGCLSPPPSG